MKFYLAPLEGITGYVYRNTYHRQFHPMDKYFTPFLVPNQNRVFKSRERSDVLSENNQGLNIIPQLMTNSAADFIWAASELQALGYQEVNLNLGCPSGTVVAKGKGAGFLADPEVLDRFFDAVFSAVEVKLSVKTRTGITAHQEFSDLLRVFNRYRFQELIIHPRTRSDYYQNKPDLEVFEEALAASGNPVCYNGDIRSAENVEVLRRRFPKLEAVMIGRGIIADPGLMETVRQKKQVDKMQLKQFHDQLCRAYEAVLPGDRTVLFKMKELWYYMGQTFADSAKYLKKIKKANRIEEYMTATNRLFTECELCQNAEMLSFSGENGIITGRS